MLPASHKISCAMVTKIVRMAKMKWNAERLKNRRIIGQIQNLKNL